MTPLAAFTEHMRFLRRKNVLSPASVRELLLERQTVALLGVLLTFDDGYENNLLAAEVLDRWKLPAVFFVSAGPIERRSTIWTAELALLLLHGEALSVELLGREWPLRNRLDRVKTFHAVRRVMKTLPGLMRRRELDRLRRQFPVDETPALLRQFSSLAMLDWRQVRQLDSAGFWVGSHGVEHEIHHAVQDVEIRRSELADSRQQIEAALGKPCRWFAFPNGDSHRESNAELRQAGYEIAFTTDVGTITASSDPLHLPRLSPGTTLRGLVRSLCVPHAHPCS
jgi:peptidoglycan/xylan/chitin deacetylase (PgdA/CDA1 family)